MSEPNFLELYQACKEGEVDVVRNWLTSYAEDGSRRSRVASKSSSSPGLVEFRSAIVPNNNAIESEDKTDMLGWTPLKIAIKYDHIELVNMLLKTFGADVNNRGGSSQRHFGGMDHSTPLFVAAFNDRSEIADLILSDSNVDVNLASTLEGYTPLMGAANNQHAEMCQKLLSVRSIDLGAQDNKHGNTALHFAAFYNSGSEILQFLLRRGGGYSNLQRLDGQTALHLAARSSEHSEDVCRRKVDMLLEFGALPTIYNYRQQLPADVCKYDSVKDILQHSAAQRSNNRTSISRARLSILAPTSEFSNLRRQSEVESASVMSSVGSEDLDSDPLWKTINQVIEQLGNWERKQPMPEDIIIMSERLKEVKRLHKEALTGIDPGLSSQMSATSMQSIQEDENKTNDRREFASALSTSASARRMPLTQALEAEVANFTTEVSRLLVEARENLFEDVFDVRPPSVLPRFMRARNHFRVIFDRSTGQIKCYSFLENAEIGSHAQYICQYTIGLQHVVDGNIKFKVADSAFKLSDDQGEWKFFATSHDVLDKWSNEFERVAANGRIHVERV